MAERPSRFTWAEDSRRYRDRATGRFVAASDVRQAVNRLADASAQRMRGLATQLQSGQITVGQFQVQMAAEIKAAHLAAGTTARGGWAQMAAQDRAFTARQIQAQYRYLHRFAADVASGKQSLSGVAARAEQYGQASRSTHRAMERDIARRLGGASEERNILGPADHCDASNGCLAQTRRGWVPIGTLLAVGARKCRVRCRCHLIFRTAEQARRARAEAAA